MYSEKRSKPKFDVLGLYFNPSTCKVQRGFMLTDAKANPKAWILISMN